MAIELNFQAAGVTRFQQSDPMKEGRIQLQRQQVVDSALGAFSTAMQERERLQKERDALQNERELQLANLTFSESESDRLNTADDKLYYDGAELPDDITIRGGRTVLEDGKEVSRRIPSFEVEPDLLRSQELSSLEDSASLITNPRERDKFVSRNKLAIEDTYQKRLEDSIDQAKEQMHAELVAQVTALALAGNFAEAREQISGSSRLTDEQKAEANADLRKGEEIYNIEGMINRQDLSLADRDTVDQMIDDLQTENYSGELSQEERISFQQSLKTKMARDQSEKDAEFFRKRGQIVSDLHVGIAKGDPTINEARIQSEYDDNILTPSEMTAMKKAIIGNRKAAKKEKKSYGDFVAAVAAGFGVDPTNPDYKRHNNREFTEALTLLETRTGEPVSRADFFTLGVQQMRRTGMAPTDIISAMRGANRDDSEGLIYAADAYNQVNDYAPHSLDDFPEHNLSLVSSVAARQAMGLPDAYAVQSAITDRDQTPMERKVNEDLYRAAHESDSGGRSAITMDLRDKLNKDEQFWIPFVIGDTAPTNESEGRAQIDDMPAEMVGQYEMLIEAYLPVEGWNYPAAAQKAFGEIKNKWGRTNINDPDASALWGGQRGFQLMPFIPHGDSKLMHSDLQHQMKDELTEGQTAILSYDFITIRQGNEGGVVSFPAWKMNKDGNPVRLDKRWTWDQTEATAVQNKAIKKVAQEKRDLLTKRGKEMKARMERDRKSRAAAVGSMRIQ